MNNSDTQGGRAQLLDNRLAMAVLLMFSYAGLQLFAGLGVGAFAGMVGWNDDRFAVATTIPILVAQGFCLFLVWRNLAAGGGVEPEDIGLRRSAIKPLYTFLFLLGFTALMLVLESFYESWTGYGGQGAIEQWLMAVVKEGTGVQAAAIAAVVVGAPLVEEFIFRGYLQSALMGKVPAAVAVASSGAVFAAFHMDLEAFPLLFASGLMLGLVYQLTRSLWPPLLLHMLINIDGLVRVFHG